MGSPTASIVIPTRGRPEYLRVTLKSIAPQASEHGAEVLVVEDGQDTSTRAVAEHAGVRYEALSTPQGANAARNAGVQATSAPLIVLIDDDVTAAPGWLAAYLSAADAHPDRDVFGGPIRPLLEGPAPRSCGRHGPPFTFLDAGEHDGEIPYAWSANMLIRRTAYERLGPFDPRLKGSGEEEEWEERYRAAGGVVGYVAAAGVRHRRTGEDVRLRALARTAYGRGRASRRYQVSRGPAPTRPAEALSLLACLAHSARRACPMGLVLAAHSAGRLREALAPVPWGTPEPFLSGHSGHVAGRTAVTRRAGDRALDALDALSGRRRRLARAASAPDVPVRDVRAVILRRPEVENTAEASRAELLRSRHHVEVLVEDVGEGGKFENLARILSAPRTTEPDWLLIVDDDVELPRGLLDGLVFLAERYDLTIAQPAQTLASHAAWEVVRRRPLSAVRETTFVEIGPVTALHRDTFSELLPFPPLRVGWGLDAHWAAIAAERGWRLGVVDAVPVRHELRPVAGHYAHAAAVAEARSFLADRPFVPREQVRTLVRHHGWR
ncbi:MAG TPA: glycosyltransferase family 2 protein [Solirubrobacteraceae bacterium]|jgi:GT2 family glycosyltransferase|nr:glycosyltransferase family 2 protein [Solirubrobacteraceae bacterium]